MASNEAIKKAVKAVELISKLHGEERTCTYLKTDANPFGPDDANIDIYSDNDDFEYWFSSETGRLIQTRPRAGLVDHGPDRADLSNRKSVNKLRSLAMKIVRRFTPDFKFKDYYLFEENRRGKLYLFRWEKKVENDGDGIPPFIQVGLYSDGKIACYSDALLD